MRFTSYLIVAVCLISVNIAGCTKHSAVPTLAPVPPADRVPPDSALEPSSLPLARSLRKFNLENPVADLEAALQRGDRRFIGTNGYTCAAPGLDYSATSTDEQNYVSTFGINCIEGTSDVVDQQLLDLTHVADDYASTYNKELLRRIRAGSVK
jgi:hypothetical protein